MRPLRLELHGFASFREPCTVDFADAELFVITGPTGSGKSSLIDGMVFALYGAVPRYEDAKLVYPLITTGTSEARVRFDFSVGDVVYTAARVVRRTAAGGATTKEARLERQRDGQVPETLAGDAHGVTDAVTKLLGLGFPHFRQCVALPQGAFAEFLRAKPKERADLLVHLLDLEIYRQMATTANLRAKGHEGKVGLLTAELAGDLATATPERLAVAEARVAELEALEKRSAVAARGIDALRQAAELAETTRNGAREEATKLAAVRCPAGIEDLGDQAEAVRDLLATRTATLTAREQALESAEATKSALPEPAVLEAILAGHERHASAQRDIETLDGELTVARAAAAEAGTLRRAAEEAVRVAEASLEEARRSDLAAALAVGLAVGDTCPVCAQTLAKLPPRTSPKALAAATKTLADAKTSLESATRAERAAASVVATGEGRLESARKTAKAAAAELEGKPTFGEARPLLEQAKAAAAAAQAAREASRQAKAGLDAARKAESDLGKVLAASWKDFDRARDGVVRSGPPEVADRNDLVGAWRDLATWAVRRAAEQTAEAAEREAEARERRAAYAAAVEEILQGCRGAGLVVTASDWVARLGEALGRARGEVTAIASAIERARDRRAELRREEERARVARDLGLHLRSSGFEAWLMIQALERLCATASQILRELSSGKYSLRMDETDFEVIDHENADEPRLARTLSGGETFLASLSLALALSEDVAQLAAGGAARLDALFLDEGFGTLDPDTLDTVATAIEALGARGRVVGLITHVRELADRMPVRFQVSKDARTSSVVRVAG